MYSVVWMNPVAEVALLAVLENVKPAKVLERGGRPPQVLLHCVVISDTGCAFKNIEITVVLHEPWILCHSIIFLMCKLISFVDFTWRLLCSQFCYFKGVPYEVKIKATAMHVLKSSGQFLIFYFNLSNAEDTFMQSTKMQRYLKNI